MQTGEQTFNEHLHLTENAIMNIKDNQLLFDSKLSVMNYCEQLLESLILIQNELNDILNSITSVRIVKIQPSLINPENMIYRLKLIATSLTSSNLVLVPNLATTAKLINIIDLQPY